MPNQEVFYDGAFLSKEFSEHLDKLQIPLSDLEDLYAVTNSGTATLYVFVTIN
jgi:hypothetical protein